MRRLVVLVAALSLSLSLALPALAPAKKKSKTQPVTITLLPGSTSTLDLGGGNVREIALTGGLKGTANARIDITKTIPIKLTKASIVRRRRSRSSTIPAVPPPLRSRPTATRSSRSTASARAPRCSTPGAARLPARRPRACASRSASAPPAAAGRWCRPATPTPSSASPSRARSTRRRAPVAGARLHRQAHRDRGLHHGGRPGEEVHTKPLVYRGKISVHLVVKVELGGPPAPTSP